MSLESQYIQQIENVSGRNDKIALIVEALQRAPDFHVGMYSCYNPFVVYNVKKIPVREGADGPGVTWIQFQALLNALASREISGKLALTTINNVMAQATNAEWNFFYRRILLRDMKAGFTEGSVNKAIEILKEKNIDLTRIPTYSCQLAHPSKKYPKKMSGKKLLEVKYDGVRLNVFVGGGQPVQVLSREGKPLTNFDYIEQQFEAAAHTLHERWMFDGEVMSNAFYSLMRQLRRKTDIDTSDATFGIFDLVPAAAIIEGTGYSMPQIQRKNQLERWFEEVEEFMPSCFLLDYEEVDLDTEIGRKALSRFNAKIIEAAKSDPRVEGTMYKDLDAPYVCDRTAAWLKEKPYITVTLEVVDVELGDPEGKNKDRMGALVCKGFDLDHNIEVKVGGGFSDEEREEFWKNRDQIIGMLVEIRADCFTENEKKPGVFSLRFPEFLRFRGFEVGEKL